MSQEDYAVVICLARSMTKGRHTQRRRGRGPAASSKGGATAAKNYSMCTDGGWLELKKITLQAPHRCAFPRCGAAVPEITGVIAPVVAEIETRLSGVPGVAGEPE